MRFSFHIPKHKIFLGILVYGYHILERMVIFRVGTYAFLNILDFGPLYTSIYNLIKCDVV